ncbi:MAG: type III pantothenate kinase [Rudaea sp.]
MKLLIDIGNTRLKCALWDGRSLRDARAIAYDDPGAGDFAALWKGMEHVESAWIASVASTARDTAVADSLHARFGLTAQFARSPTRACGVTSAYARPNDLGVDRFLGMIAAHALEQRACVVVSCGTALTLDALAADGTHLGGLIVPGLRLMREGLLGGTARLGETPPASVVEMADNTADAIESGIRLAAVAVIERFVTRTAARLREEPVVILSGGDASRVGRLLAIRHRVEADIVLRGLAIFADAAGCV